MTCSRGAPLVSQCSGLKGGVDGSGANRIVQRPMCDAAKPGRETDQTMLLKIDNLAKTYRTGAEHVEVLRDVSFDMRAGESVALEGESGSGKSTVLHMIAGLDAPTGGSIKIEAPKSLVLVIATVLISGARTSG